MNSLQKAALKGISAVILATALPAEANDIYMDQIEYDLAEKWKRERQQARQQQSQPGAAPKPESDNAKNTATDESSDQRFSGLIKVDLLSDYISYGVTIQEEGATIQTLVSLRYSFFDKAIDNRPESFVNNVTGFISQWNDFSTSDNLSSPTSSFKNFTELDLIAGLSITMADRLNFTASATTYTSPADAFGQGAYIKADIAYNDLGQTAKNFGLMPRITLLYTIPWDSTLGLQSDSVLFEPGLTPTYIFQPESSLPVTLSLPLRVGLGNKFYDGSTYGFFSVGPQLTIPIKALSNETFSAFATLGYTYINLGPTTTDFILNTDKESNKHVFNFGIGASF
ncbi:hypothetical protein [Cyanobium sp. CH-040]|uniref:hypothetical protein n=1 Tax=Cyanobium sp. CH-040 TaxID=2823708 RepID=UPI0020CF0836|nr:hypothetical protein [Cyanobium sp. CH-040]MCP9926696.1 hypothetical protein [Cyanobium sp. CH-040]